MREGDVEMSLTQLSGLALTEIVRGEGAAPALWFRRAFRGIAGSLPFHFSVQFRAEEHGIN